VIDPYLYRGRIDYASALRHATRQLTRLMQPRELSATLRQILTEAFVPESFSMSVLPSQGKALEQLSEGAPLGMDVQTLVSLSTDRSSPMVVVVNPAGETHARKVTHDALLPAGTEVVRSLGRKHQLFGPF